MFLWQTCFNLIFAWFSQVSENLNPHVQPDVNYDDVQMEMSDDEDDGDEEDEEDAKSSSSEESEKTVAEKNLFASEEDYLAYKKQVRLVPNKLIRISISCLKNGVVVSKSFNKLWIWFSFQSQMDPLTAIKSMELLLQLNMGLRKHYSKLKIRE